jgi:hypothetical protein
MSPALRILGFVFSFAIVATALTAQLSARPTMSVATEISEARAHFEKPSRPRVGRMAELRRLPRAVVGVLA